MKPSNYNFFFPYEADDDKVIAYNSFSNALALMNKEQHGVFKRFCDEGIAIDDSNFVEQLMAEHFIIEDSCDEIDRLRVRMLANRYSTRHLGLTIAPTSDCNFRCPYCYEKDAISQCYMNQQVQDKIVELVMHQSKYITYLSVSWYGGEPLLAFDTIESLSKRLIEICNEKDITYNANIVTNGYLLTRDVVTKMNDLQISSIQITIDGTKDTHDARRPHVDGQGTYDTILKNIIDNVDILPFTSIRVNVDKDNIHSAGNVIDTLKQHDLLGKIKPYLGRITPDNDTYDSSRCFDICSFSGQDFEYFSSMIDDAEFMRRYPVSASNVCLADCFNAFVVSADGSLYKCWIDIGNDSRCIGNIVDGSGGNQDLLHKYLLNDPTENIQCSKCKLLPVCMGGCPYKRLNSDESCSIYKYTLASYMNLIAEKVKQSSSAIVSA